MVCSVPNRGLNDGRPLRSPTVRRRRRYFFSLRIHFRCSIIRLTGKVYMGGALSRRYFPQISVMLAEGLMLRAPDFLEHGVPLTASVPTKYITVLRLISGDCRHRRCIVVSPTFRTKINSAVCTVFVYTCIIATNVQNRHASH